MTGIGVVPLGFSGRGVHGGYDFILAHSMMQDQLPLAHGWGTVAGADVLFPNQRWTFGRPAIHKLHFHRSVVSSRPKEFRPILKSRFSSQQVQLKRQCETSDDWKSR